MIISWNANYVLWVKCYFWLKYIRNLRKQKLIFFFHISSSIHKWKSLKRLRLFENFEWRVKPHHVDWRMDCLNSDEGQGPDNKELQRGKEFYKITLWISNMQMGANASTKISIKLSSLIDAFQSGHIYTYNPIVSCIIYNYYCG